jgi:hypothetical protein
MFQRQWSRMSLCHIYLKAWSWEHQCHGMLKSSIQCKPDQVKQRQFSLFSDFKETQYANLHSAYHMCHAFFSGTLLKFLNKYTLEIMIQYNSLCSHDYCPFYRQKKLRVKKGQSSCQSSELVRAGCWSQAQGCWNCFSSQGLTWDRHMPPSWSI